MSRLTMGAVAVAVLSLAGVVGLAIRCEVLAERVRGLERPAPVSPIAPAQDASSAKAISDLRRTISQLEAQLAAAKARPATVEPAKPPITPITPIKPEPSGHDPLMVDKQKVKIMERMRTSANSFLEREGTKIGLSDTQKGQVLGLLYEQITEIARLDPKDGKVVLEEQMNTINLAYTDRIMKVLQTEQRSRYMESARGWFGGMMLPKSAEPPPAHDHEAPVGPRAGGSGTDGK